MRLSKHHGLGNDFLITFAGEVRPDAPALARRLCHRTEGIGADGLILLTPGSGDADVAMTLLNADGSLAEISGNGLRCVGQALSRRDGVARGEYVVDTGSGPRHVEVTSTDGSTSTVAAEMGPVAPLDAPAVVALSIELTGAPRAGAGTIGNPHIVAMVDDPAAVDLREVGGAIEAAVPGGANAEFIRIVDADLIELTVWERGAGATQACGTGACVSAWLANKWGLVGDTVDVRMPGGDATVQLGPSVTLTGPATHIVDVEVS